MKFLITNQVKSLLQFGASACGAVAAASTGNVALAGGLLALGASTTDLGLCVLDNRQDDYLAEIEAAQKQLDNDLRLDAFVSGKFDDDDIELTYAELSSVLPRLKLSHEDFVKWGLKPNLISKAMTSLLNNEKISPFFHGNEQARLLAGRIIFHSFTTLREKQAFWANSELYFAETVLVKFGEMQKQIESVKQDTEKLRENSNEILGYVKAMAQDQGISITSEDALNFEKSLQHLLDDRDNRRALARTAAKDNRLDDAIHQILSVARQDAAAADDLNKSTAKGFRMAGALAYPINTAQALDAYENAVKYDGTVVWDYIYLSRLYKRSGTLNGAKTALTDAQRLDNSLRDQSVLLNDLGDVAVDQGDLPAARSAYEEVLAIFERLVKADPSNTEFQNDLSISLERMGDIEKSQGNLDKAKSYFMRKNEVDKTLVEKDPSNTKFQRDLTIGFNKIGDVALAQGDLPAAQSAYEDSLAIADRLAKADPSNTQFQRDLSVSYDRLGDVAVAQRNLPAARSAYEEDLAISERLAKADPSNTELQRDLIVSFVKLSEAFPNEAETYLSQALGIAQALKQSGKLAPKDNWMVADLQTRLDNARNVE